MFILIPRLKDAAERLQLMVEAFLLFFQKL